MSSDLNDRERRAAAQANLARRREELKRSKRPNKKARPPKKTSKPGKRSPVLPFLALIILIFLLIMTVLQVRQSLERKAANDAKIVIGLKGSAVQLVQKDEPYIENGAFAIDRENGAIDPEKIKIKGKVDTGTPGDYPVTYKVRSNGGNAEVTRTVRVLGKDDFGDPAGSVPILMYHWVYTQKHKPDSIDGNWILDSDLDKQLSYLEEKDFYYPGWAELRAWVDGEISMPQNSIVLTFDDGKKEFLKYGIPVLEKHQIPATSFMIGWDKNDGEGKVKKYASPYIDFESHTFGMHQAASAGGHKGIVNDMTQDEIKKDLAKAAQLVGSNDAIAYPYGDYTDDILKAVNDLGILCGVTTEYDRVRQGQDPAKLPRVRVLGDESFDTWKNSVS